MICFFVAEMVFHKYQPNINNNNNNNLWTNFIFEITYTSVNKRYMLHNKKFIRKSRFITPSSNKKSFLSFVLRTVVKQYAQRV